MDLVPSAEIENSRHIARLGDEPLDGNLTGKRLLQLFDGKRAPLKAALLDQRLIGVLGLTGEPELLRTYAELVRMTAEMLVGQRFQQAEQLGLEEHNQYLVLRTQNIDPRAAPASVRVGSRRRSATMADATVLPVDGGREFITR